MCNLSQYYHLLEKASLYLQSGNSNDILVTSSQKRFIFEICRFLFESFLSRK